MKQQCVLMGVLLFAAPLFSAQPVDLLQFQLTETTEQVRAKMGAPAMEAPFGDFLSWRYQMDSPDGHDFSHELVFRKSTGELISFTRNFDPERTVDDVFPPAETEVYYFPDAAHPEYSVRLRRLSGGRLLLAPGSGQPGAPAGQLMLIRDSELRNFVSWLKLEER